MAQTARCPNCDAVASDRYCPSCGQRQLGRWTLRTLAGEFVSRFFSAERGLGRTLLTMLARPGQATRDALDGRRARYVSPLVWYAICAGAQVLGLLLLSEPLGAFIGDNLPPVILDYQRQHGIDDPVAWSGERYVAVLQNAYSWFGLLALVLPMALILRLILWRPNLAECLVTALHAVAFPMLLTACTGQVLVRISPFWHSIVSYTIYVAYALLTAGNAFGWSVRSVLAGLLGILGAGMCFIAALGFLTVYSLTHWFP